MSDNLFFSYFCLLVEGPHGRVYNRPMALSLLLVQSGFGRGMELDQVAKGLKKKPAVAHGRRVDRSGSKKRVAKPGVEVSAGISGTPPLADIAHAANPERLPMPTALGFHPSSDVLNRLWQVIETRKGADPEVSHSARLLAKGASRVAQKLGEEAIECVIELMAGNRSGLVGESADVIYHLLVAWVQAGIRPEEIWRELEHRERVSYLTEGADVPFKRLLGNVQVGTRKIP